MKVDFPHPDGPMMAVTAVVSNETVISLSAWFDPNHALRPEASNPLTWSFAAAGSTGSAR